jgi:Asp-tRNA(Asn)/Glu-tRNA(Gln) amidotransferase A subunit family amidase
VASVLWNEWRADAAAPPPDGRRQTGLTFVLLEDAYTAQADDEIRKEIASVADTLAQYGHNIVRTALYDRIDPINEAHNAMIAREFAETHKRWFLSHSEFYSEKSRELIERGRSVLDGVYSQAKIGRDRERARMNALLDAHQAVALLTPSAPGAAPEGLGATGSPLLNLPWTYAGVPTVTLRAGVNTEGLPLGLQLVGRAGEDEEVLAVASLIERTITV